MNLFSKLFGTRMSFIDYSDYKARMQFLDRFRFQQQTRKQSVENMPGVGGK